MRFGRCVACVSCICMFCTSLALIAFVAYLLAYVFASLTSVASKTYKGLALRWVETGHYAVCVICFCRLATWGMSVYIPPKSGQINFYSKDVRVVIELIPLPIWNFIPPQNKFMATPLAATPLCKRQNSTIDNSESYGKKTSFGGKLLVFRYFTKIFRFRKRFLTVILGWVYNEDRTQDYDHEERHSLCHIVFCKL